MTRGSTVDKNKLERCLAQYRSEVISEFSEIKTGIANDKFLVKCASEKAYVIRILRDQTPSSAESEALIQRLLAGCNIYSPLYLRLANGKFVGLDNNDAFTISEYIHGVHPKKVSLGLARSLGKVMAKLHEVLVPQKIHLAFNTGQWFNPQNVYLQIANCTTARRHQLQELVDRSSEIFKLDLPKAIIHGDLANNNIYVKDCVVTAIFDFETAEYTIRLLDLAYTYLAIAYDEHLEPNRIYDALSQGYNHAAKQPLTKLEKELFWQALLYVTAAAAAWCYARDFNEFGDKFLSIGTKDAKKFS